MGFAIYAVNNGAVRYAGDLTSSEEYSTAASLLVSPGIPPTSCQEEWVSVHVRFCGKRE